MDGEYFSSFVAKVLPIRSVEFCEHQQHLNRTHLFPRFPLILSYTSLKFPPSCRKMDDYILVFLHSVEDKGRNGEI